MSAVADAALAAAAALLAGTGALAATVAAYLLALALAAFRHGRQAPADGWEAAAPRLQVLVPAHDEAALIGRCVRSLRAQQYPSDRFDVTVVADNCTDDTAARAAAAGARVLVRRDETARGKGHALRWATERLLGRGGHDAVVVVDADSVADPMFLALLAARRERGAVAVQGESLIAPDGTEGSALRAAAFLLVNRVRPAGRAALGLPAHLTGNGMLLDRALLLAHPWDAYTSAEDLEYSLTLRLAGIRPAYAGGAVLTSPAAPDRASAERQRLRWEGGKLHAVRTRLPALVRAGLRRRDVTLLEAALDLATPPLGLLAATIVAGLGTAAPLALLGAVGWWTVAPWLAAALALALHVLLGLRAAGAPRAAYRALLGAPALVLRKVLGLPALLGSSADTWVRTERAPRTSRRPADRP